MLRYFILVVSVLSIYLDQVGTYDWHKHHIGRIREIYAIAGGKSIAISERGLLALIKPSGELEWRRLVSSLDAQVQVAFSLSGVFTYADGTLSMWSIQEGQILWTKAISHVLFMQLISIANIEVLVTVQNETVEFFTTQEGESLKALRIAHVGKIVPSNKNFLFVLGGGDTLWKINTKSWNIEEVKFRHNADTRCNKVVCLTVFEEKAEIFCEGEVKEVELKIGKVTNAADKFFVLEDGTLIEIEDFRVKVIKNIEKHVFAENSAMWVTQGTGEIRLHGLEFKEILVKGSQNLPGVSKLWTYQSSKGEVQSFALLDNYALLSFRDSAIRWVREEGLGHVKSVYFMELPSKEMHAHNQYFSYIKDHNQWTDVVANLFLRLESQIKKPTLQVEALEKDTFAFKKLILAVSNSGYLFAIQSLDAQIYWQVKIMNIKKIIQIGPEEALAVSSYPTFTLLSYIKILTGEVIKTKSLDFLTESILQIGSEEDVQLYLVNENFDVFPIISRQSQNIFFYKIDSSKNTIEGFEHTSSGKRKTWAIKIATNETIQSYITNRSGKIHQPAIATGTSRLIYKYADENLFAVSTQKGFDMFIYVINSVSGHVVYRIHQEGVNGKVHLAFHEHKLFTHYWNMKFERFEVLSVEFFKTNVDDSASDVLKSYYSGSFSTEYSSKFTPDITTFTQTYIFPYGVKDMKVTTTLQGITKPTLVMILNSNSVYLLDTTQLSPRRKQEDSHEEGLFDDPSLMPYKPILPWSSVNVANYYLQFEGLEKLETADTWLESTSIVLAYGLDLFVVRVMPEKSFDALSEDFSKSAIILTIGGLVCLNILVQKWFSSKNAKEKFNI